MNPQPSTNLEAGERPTEVEVRDAGLLSSRTPQRHDPASFKFNRLIVRKEGGLFVLRSFKDGHELECVKAVNAQQILDYVRSTWPVGTTIDWVIIPRAPRTITATYQLTAERDRSWLKRIPVGSHL